MAGTSVVRLVLLIFALVCFALAAWMPTAPYYARLVAAGLGFLSASMVPWPV
jgi:hypothetical protein